NNVTLIRGNARPPPSHLSEQTGKFAGLLDGQQCPPETFKSLSQHLAPPERLARLPGTFLRQQTAVKTGEAFFHLTNKFVGNSLCAECLLDFIDEFVNK